MQHLYLRICLISIWNFKEVKSITKPWSNHDQNSFLGLLAMTVIGVITNRGWSFLGVIRHIYKNAGHVTFKRPNVWTMNSLLCSPRDLRSVSVFTPASNRLSHWRAMLRGASVQVLCGNLFELCPGNFPALCRLSIPSALFVFVWEHVIYRIIFE